MAIRPTGLANLAAGLGGLAAFSGITAVLQPERALAVLGYPNATSPMDEKLVHALVQRFGVRDIAFGTSILAMWYFGTSSTDNNRYKPLGASILAGSLMTILDGVLSKQLIGGSEWKHWCFTPVNIGLGIGLLWAP